MDSVQGFLRYNQGHLKPGNPKKPGPGRDHQSDRDGEGVATAFLAGYTLTCPAMVNSDSPMHPRTSRRKDCLDASLIKRGGPFRHQRIH